MSTLSECTAFSFYGSNLSRLFFFFCVVPNFGIRPHLSENITDGPRGDEWRAQYWEAADAAKPVFVRQAAAYQHCCTGAPDFQLLSQATGASLLRVNKQNPLNGQSMLPSQQGDNTKFNEGSATVTEPFVVMIDGYRSDAPGWACTFTHCVVATASSCLTPTSSPWTMPHLTTMAASIPTPTLAVRNLSFYCLLLRAYRFWFLLLTSDRRQLRLPGQCFLHDQRQARRHAAHRRAAAGDHTYRHQRHHCSSNHWRSRNDHAAHHYRRCN